MLKKINEKTIIAISIFLAIIGIFTIFMFSEIEKKYEISEALISPEKTKVELTGIAKNITASKFMLCKNLCISVKTSDPIKNLIYENQTVKVFGVVESYKGKKYVVAEKIERG
jgi:hypothetical protein